MLLHEVRRQPIGFARGGAITDGDQLDLVLARELREDGTSSQRRCGSCG